jgi:hypothetical protein
MSNFSKSVYSVKIGVSEGIERGKGEEEESGAVGGLSMRNIVVVFSLLLLLLFIFMYLRFVICICTA